MLKILRGQINILVVTLNEAGFDSSLPASFFFYSTEYDLLKQIELMDTSLHPERYNKFTLIEKDTPLIAGEISLPFGEWLYEVYQSGNMLEQGQVIVL